MAARGNASLGAAPAVLPPRGGSTATAGPLRAASAAPTATPALLAAALSALSRGWGDACAAPPPASASASSAAAPILSLEGARAALRALPASSPLAALADGPLRDALAACGAVCIRGVYVPPTLAVAQGAAGAEALAEASAAAAAAASAPAAAAASAPSLAPPSSLADAAYRLMLEVLSDRPSFRKTDLQSAIKAASLPAGAAAGDAAAALSEAQLARVVKVLCRSRGNQWCLKDVN